MKKIILIIIAVLFYSSSKGQDAIVVGARNYYKAHLKNPSSYIEYSNTKKNWTKLDELRSSLEEYSFILYDSTVITDLERERDKFEEAVNSKIKNLEEKNEVLKIYSDSTKFLQDFSSLKKTELDRLNRELKVEKTMYGTYASWGFNPGSKLEEAKEKGNVDDILRYQKEVDVINENIKNLEDYVKTLSSYKNLHLIKYTQNQQELNFLKQINSYKKDQIEKFDSLAILDYRKSYNEQICSSCGMYSYYYERYQERMEATKKTKEINKKIAFLKSNPSQNTILYYYVILDNSGTNSYGARVREKNIIKYNLKTKQYEILD
jgi:hypothetical protein